MHVVGDAAPGDAASRTAGQHARAAVLRLRLRTLVTLGVLAVATAALGRTFGLHDVRFLGSEVALLASIFVVSRYVMPLVDRRDRGARAEEHVGSLLDALPADEWRVIHDATLGHGNIDHILIGPPGVFTVETKSHPGPVRVGRVHGATIRQAQAQRDAIARATGTDVEPLLVFSRAWVDRRWRGARACACCRGGCSSGTCARARRRCRAATSRRRANGSRRSCARTRAASALHARAGCARVSV